MIFGEWIYGAFLIVAALVFRFLPPRARGWWLAACGLGFYAYYAQAFLWLVIAEIVVIYLLTREARRHVWAFVAALAVTGGALVLIKYGWLVSSTAADAAMALRLGRLPTFPQLVLPLAISFFTFEFIHYVVDARKGILPPHAPVDFFAFALFFPDDGRRPHQALRELPAADRRRQSQRAGHQRRLDQNRHRPRQEDRHRRHACATGDASAQLTQVCGGQAP